MTKTSFAECVEQSELTHIAVRGLSFLIFFIYLVVLGLVVAYQNFAGSYEACRLSSRGMQA